MIQNGYPNEASKFKKTSDILVLRQKLINDNNLSELALKHQLNKIMRVGKQEDLRTKPKTLSEVYKCMVAGHYYDKEFDMEALKEIIRPHMIMLLEKYILVINKLGVIQQSQTS